MPYAIELLFDEKSTSRVREAWSLLAGVTGNDYLARNGVTPHVALAALDAVPEAARLEETLETLTSDTTPQPLEQMGIDSFASERPVVYMGFTKCDFLESIHNGVETVLGALGLTNHEYYQWDEWVPHCTLAMEFSEEHLEAAISAAEAVQWNIPFSAVGLELIAYPPTRSLWSSPLGE